MAIKYIGSNLFTRWGNGTFETDPTGWAPIMSTGFYFLRYNQEFYQGAHSCLIGCNDPSKTSFQFGYFTQIATKGKKYEMSVWVKNDAENPFCNENSVIEFIQLNSTRINILDKNVLNVSAITGNWTKIWVRFEVNPALDSAQEYFSISIARANLSPQFSTSGFLYLDKAECYEYVIEGNPDPDPDPDPDPTDPDPEPDPGPDLTIKDVFFFHNPITVDIPAVGNINALNFTIRNTVMVNKNIDGSTFLPVLPMDLEPDINGISQFWANAAFKGYLKATPPAATDTNIIRLKDRITRFRYKFGEMSGTDFEPATHNFIGDFLVILGGISKEVYPDFDFFNTYMKENKKFLTWQPEIKNVDRIQEEFLYFLLWDKAPSYNVPAVINLKVKVYYNNNTTDEAIVKTLNNPGLGWLLQVPAGFANSGAQALDPEGVVLKYDLWLEDGSTVISEIRTFIIDQEVHPYTRYFIFRNSLGGYDTVRTTGIVSKSAKFTREEIEKFVPADYSLQDGQFATINADLQNEYDLSTGHVTKRYADYLQDMLLGKDVFEIVKGRRIPVVISNTSAVLAEDKRNLWFVRFDMKFAFKNRVYTPDL